MAQHEPLVWGPAAEGERTSSGREVTMPGWVWTCTCGQSGFGYKDEKEADDWCDAHIERDRNTTVTFNPLIQRANPVQVTEVVVIDKSQQEAWLEAFGEVVRRFDGTWMGGSIEEGE